MSLQKSNKARVFILAIDPGSTESALAELRDGELLRTAKISNAAMLLFLEATVPDAELTIEMISSYGMPVGKEVFDTCVWIGRFQQAYKGPSRLVYRKTIVGRLCNDAKATDKNVRQVVIDHFGPPGTKKNPGATFGVTKDCWAALGVALYALEVPLEQS